MWLFIMVSRFGGGKNGLKMGFVIANFTKIEACLKALYVRKKGIPEGGLKALQIKGFEGG